ncbi:MAG: hypothetical protein QF578_18725, partial [Alphaproteobacteria bacterium]|nr:hypothetical protein [Alphaproteobacteria bacterium]
MSQGVLYAFYDLEITWATYDSINFLVLADIERERRGLEHVHVVIVPGRTNGFQDTAEYPDFNKEWRQRQIVISGIGLLPSARGHTVCQSRSQAEQLRRELARHVFPATYTVDEPYTDIYFATIVEHDAAGRRVDRLQAPAAARAEMRTWLDRIAHGRRVVTITLRECIYDDYRNSLTDNWLAFAREIQAEGFCPVIVRDTETTFETLPPEFDGLPVCPQAAVNMELRAALYAEAYLNTGINQGPFTLWHFMQEVPYLCCYIVGRYPSDIRETQI